MQRKPLKPLALHRKEGQRPPGTQRTIPISRQKGNERKGPQTAHPNQGLSLGLDCWGWQWEERLWRPLLGRPGDSIQGRGDAESPELDPNRPEPDISFWLGEI